MRFVMTNIFPLFLLVVYPLGSLISIGINFFIGEKKVIYIALFMGIVGYNFIPNIEMDLQRHWDLYSIVQKFDFDKLLDYLKDQKDYFLVILMYIFSKFNLNHSSINGFFVFSTYFIFLKNFLNIISHDNKKIFIKMLLIVFLYISLIDSVSGLRTMLSLACVLYGYNNIYCKDKTKEGLFFLLLATTIHVMSSVFLVPLVFVRFVNNSKIYKVIFFMSFLFYFIPLDEIFVSKIFSIVPFLKRFEEHILNYLSGQWNGDFLKNYNQNGLIVMYGRKISGFWIGCIYLITTLRLTKLSKIGKITLLVFSFTNMLTYKYVNFFICYERAI